MGCFISGYNGNPTYSEFMYENSGGWVGYIVAGLLSVVLIVILKGWQLYKFDLVRAIYNYQSNKYNFNISNWIIYNLLWASLIHGHFYFFNFIFEGKTEPCVGM